MGFYVLSFVLISLVQVNSYHYANPAYNNDYQQAPVPPPQHLKGPNCPFHQEPISVGHLGDTAVGTINQDGNYAFSKYPSNMYQNVENAQNYLEPQGHSYPAPPPYGPYQQQPPQYQQHHYQPQYQGQQQQQYYQQPQYQHGQWPQNNYNPNPNFYQPSFEQNYYEHLGNQDNFPQYQQPNFYEQGNEYPGDEQEFSAAVEPYGDDSQNLYPGDDTEVTEPNEYEEYPEEQPLEESPEPFDTRAPIEEFAEIEEPAYEPVQENDPAETSALIEETGANLNKIHLTAIQELDSSETVSKKKLRTGRNSVGRLSVEGAGLVYGNHMEEIMETREHAGRQKRSLFSSPKPKESKTIAPNNSGNLRMLFWPFGEVQRAAKAITNPFTSILTPDFRKSSRAEEAMPRIQQTTTNVGYNKNQRVQPMEELLPQQSPVFEKPQQISQVTEAKTSLFGLSKLAEPENKNAMKEIANSVSQIKNTINPEHIPQKLELINAKGNDEILIPAKKDLPKVEGQNENIRSFQEPELNKIQTIEQEQISQAPEMINLQEIETKPENQEEGHNHSEEQIELDSVILNSIEKIEQEQSSPVPDTNNLEELNNALEISHESKENNKSEELMEQGANVFESIEVAEPIPNSELSKEEEQEQERDHLKDTLNDPIEPILAFDQEKTVSENEPELHGNKLHSNVPLELEQFDISSLDSPIDDHVENMESYNTCLIEVDALTRNNVNANANEASKCIAEADALRKGEMTQAREGVETAYQKALEQLEMDSELLTICARSQFELCSQEREDLQKSTYLFTEESNKKLAFATNAEIKFDEDVDQCILRAQDIQNKLRSEAVDEVRNCRDHENVLPY